MRKAGPKMRPRPVLRSAPSRAQTQMGKATNSAGNTNQGAIERAATAPATNSNRKRRQPWLSMVHSARRVMRTNQGATASAASLAGGGGDQNRLRRCGARLLGGL